MKNNHRKFAFTLAEVLITLGIIGVVAAITIPGLITSYKAHQLHSQFMKATSTIQQAFKQMEVDDVSLNPADYDGRTFYKIFQNYFKVAVNCEVMLSKGTPCSDGVYRTFDGNHTFDYHLLDDGQFVLQDGTLILIENPTVSDGNYVFVFFDLNGTQKPNILGYDLFAMEFQDGELRTMGDRQTKYSDLEQYCNLESSNSFNGIACAHRAKTETDYFKWAVKNIK